MEILYPFNKFATEPSLNSIFNVIEPNEINKDTYGHKIRELLIISCTEVEYLLRKILTDNGYGIEQHLTTNDYVKVRPLLKLDEYRVKLKFHPSMGSFSPFKDWNDKKPTKSLDWYDAYNQTKHNRGENFYFANLNSTIDLSAK